MNSLTAACKAVTALVPVTVISAACDRAQPPPLAPAGAMMSLNALDAPMRYGVVGDCRGATILDPGIESMVGGVVLRRGAVFDCPLTGDIEGTTRVVLNATLHNAGTPDVHGRLFGTTTFFVTSFFGRTDLSGTFEGPFNSSLAAIQSGEAMVTRHGTGDFLGLVMHGVAVSDPPGSANEVESGELVGREQP